MITFWGWVRGTRAKAKECKFSLRRRSKKPSAAADENDEKPKPKPEIKGKPGAPEGTPATPRRTYLSMMMLLRSSLSMPFFFLRKGMETSDQETFET